MNRLLSSIAVSALLIGGAQAADIPAYEPAPAAPTMEAPFSWTGFYLGVAAGYGMTDYDLEIEDELTGAPFGFGLGVDGFSGEGWLGEASVGFDYQVGRMVLGVLGDVRWTNFETDAYAEIELPAGEIETATLGVEGSIETELGWDALVRAGFLVNDRALLYALGGYSYQQFDLGYDIYGPAEGGPFPSDSTDEDRHGWTVGVGLEAMLTQNVSLKTEYRYTQFDDISYDIGELIGGEDDSVAELSLDPSQHTFAVGVNYKFKGLFGM